MSWYGLLIGLAIAVGLAGAYGLLKLRRYNADIVFDLAIVCIPLAIIGLRLHFVFFDILSSDRTWGYWFEGGRIFGVVRDANGRISIRLAGLAIYGGLFAAALGTIFIVRPLNKRKKDPLKQMTVWQMFDMGFILVILGQAIGRWGNIANRELLGAPVSNQSWQWMPIARQDDFGVWRMALPAYESFFNLIGFGLMLWFFIGRRKSFDGFIFAFYCIWYGAVRAVLEPMRTDTYIMRMWQGGLPVNLAISICLILLGVGIIAFHIYKAHKTGKKRFLFVDELKLDTSYYGFEQTIIYLHQINDKKLKRKTSDARGSDDKSGSGFSYSENESAGIENNDDGKTGE